MRSSRAVAVRATAIVSIAYVLFALVINVAFGARGLGTLDRELAETLGTLRHASHAATSAQSVIGYFGGGARIDPDDQLDKVPVAYWWVPAGGAPISADAAIPALPLGLVAIDRPVTAKFGRSNFRVSGAAVSGGRWVVAMSTAEAGHETHVLEVTELLLLPIILGGFFLTAFLIGHRAAAPIEDARRRHLAFTADASHELRTPVSVIDAEVGLALSAERDASYYRSALERVSAETGRLKGIIEELFWLVRFDSGPRRPPSEPVDLSALASACSGRFTGIAARRSITIEVSEAEPGEAIMHAPPEWIDRLVSVLVDNACRYGAPNSRVEVRITKGDSGPVLTVDDQGPGISEEERDRIFERFHRATTVEGGSGLGLAIADAVVGATGGRWTVGESPSGGARLQVSW